MSNNIYILEIPVYKKILCQGVGGGGGGGVYDLLLYVHPSQKFPYSFSPKP